MDIRKIALIFGALVIAGVTAFMARNMFSGRPAPAAQQAAAPVPENQVLVAVRTLPAGTIVDDSTVRAQVWPKDMIDGNMLMKGSGSVSGRVVRYTVPAGQPITNSALIKPGDRGFLAAALGPGMRAVTVPVTATSGVAGFVFPGDRVDVLLTQEITGSSSGSPMTVLKTAETIVRNVRVLATDQNTLPQGEAKDPAVKPSTMVTLEGTPRIAEKIAVAQSMGTISLSLRSIADTSQELDALIASGDVQVPANAKGGPQAEKAAMLAFASRPSDLHATATTGGEVSRFRRSTVPADYSERSAAIQDAAQRATANLSIGTATQQLRQQAVVVRRGSSDGAR
jgi:pilus assembly protein CpaB